MIKTISWQSLHKRIGKQPLHKTSEKVQIMINGNLYECALIFTHNGSDFHLEPIKEIKKGETV